MQQFSRLISQTWTRFDKVIYYLRLLVTFNTSSIWMSLNTHPFLSKPCGHTPQSFTSTWPYSHSVTATWPHSPFCHYHESYCTQLVVPILWLARSPAASVVHVRAVAPPLGVPSQHAPFSLCPPEHTQLATTATIGSIYTVAHKKQPLGLFVVSLSNLHQS